MKRPLQQRQRRVIIFDFDGTLADTFVLALRIFSETSHRQVSEADISRLRGLSSLELLHELKIHVWQIPLLAWRTRRKLAAEVTKIDLIPGMDAVVRELSRHYHLFVLSSNRASNVRSVLQRFNLAEQFVGIYGDARILRKGRSLRNLLRHNQIQPREACYVGDETRDIDAARAVGMPVVAVSWGFNNIAALERHHPDALVFTPDELLKYFSGHA